MVFSVAMRFSTLVVYVSASFAWILCSSLMCTTFDLKYLSTIYGHQTMLFTFIFMWYTHYLYSRSVSNFFFLSLFLYIIIFIISTAWNGVSFMYFKWKFGRCFVSLPHSCARSFAQCLLFGSMKSFWSIDIKGLCRQSVVACMCVCMCVAGAFSRFLSVKSFRINLHKVCSSIFRESCSWCFVLKSISKQSHHAR